MSGVLADPAKPKETAEAKDRGKGCEVCARRVRVGRANHRAARHCHGNVVQRALWVASLLDASSLSLLSNNACFPLVVSCVVPTYWSVVRVLWLHQVKRVKGRNSRCRQDSHTPNNWFL